MDTRQYQIAPGGNIQRVSAIGEDYVDNDSNELDMECSWVVLPRYTSQSIFKVARRLLVSVDGLKPATSVQTNNGGSINIVASDEQFSTRPDYFSGTSENADISGNTRIGTEIVYGFATEEERQATIAQAQKWSGRITIEQQQGWTENFAITGKSEYIYDIPCEEVPYENS